MDVRPAGNLPFRLTFGLFLVILTACPAFGQTDTSAHLMRLSVEPAHVHLNSADGRQQVAVTGHFADGSVRDVTLESTFRIETGHSAAVSPVGVLSVKGDGESLLVIKTADQQASVSVSVTNAGHKRPVSYRQDVVAVLSKAGCNMGTCHGNLNGKGGFRLSLRGDDPTFDFSSLTRDAFGRRVDRNHPDQSMIVLKPTGLLAHEGGPRFSPDSSEAKALMGWIAQGARDDASQAATVTKLSVFPADRISAAPSLTQQLVVTAEFSNGTRRDVTREASFDVNDPTRVSVTADGRVESQKPGETVVAVRYLTGRAVSRLTFLPDRPDFAWTEITPANEIDTHVFAKLKAHKIHPSEPAGDSTFVRRAYLDALGRLPSVDEVRAFLADTSPDRRDRLIDRLLTRPEFADFWALKWADLLRNEEKAMGLKGVWSFQRWLRDALEADLPLDEFVRRIVSARGSTWQNPPASFYRTNRDPQTAAETVGQVFLGVRLQCARCHNHPFDVWTQDDYYGLAAYFNNLARKQVDNQRKDNLDKHEINGDEIVYFAGNPGMVQPRSGEMMAPKPPGGPKPNLSGDPNALDDLASWLTRDNPRFRQNIANRIWFHLMGRGIVDPVDDFRDSNPPSNPALLDAITDAFVKDGMRLRPLVALIMKSKAYQLDAKPNATNADDESNFARASVRLMPAEVLLDAMGQALDKPESFSNAPSGTRAVSLAGVKGEGPFLKIFGKPERLLTCECERSESTTLAQAFQLINGELVRRKLEASDNRIGRLIQADACDPEILEDVYLATLSRLPTAAEAETTLAYLAKANDRRKAWEDIAWALLNSKEFLLRH